MPCQNGRTLSECISLEVKELMSLDRCQIEKILRERFRSEHFLRLQLEKLLRDMSKSRTLLQKDRYNRIIG